MKNYMKILKKIYRKIKYIGVPYNKRLDTFFARKISKITGFDEKKIFVIKACKKDETKNEFDYYEFEYKNNFYILKNNKLNKVNSKN